VAVNEIQVPAEVSRLASQVSESVREILGPATRVLWFGSWVRGTAASRSDIDLAIVADRRVPPTVMAQLRERVDDLPTLRKIDLVDALAVSEAMRERILSEGVAL
jgi:predicted nucleotidyltransferase